MAYFVRHQTEAGVRKIIEGTAYDTDTGELIHAVHNEHTDEAESLYRTRNGAFFLYIQYVTHGGNLRFEIVPKTDEESHRWLEGYGNTLVEKVFGEMPEGGSAERRLTLRIPNNLARRIDELALAQKLTMTRYINRCLERCAREDGKPSPLI